MIRHKIAEMTTEAKVNRALYQSMFGAVGEKPIVNLPMLVWRNYRQRKRKAELLMAAYSCLVDTVIWRNTQFQAPYTDARVQRIYGGTSEIMKEIISKDVLGK